MKPKTYQEYQYMFTVLPGNVPMKAGSVTIALGAILGEACPSYNTIQKFFRIEKYKHLDPITYDLLTSNEISLFKADKLIAEKRKKPIS